MLIQHVYRSYSYRSSSSSLTRTIPRAVVVSSSFSLCRRNAGTSTGTLSKWSNTKGRTRSVLFDEDNPITNKELHKLHKRPWKEVHDVTTDNSHRSSPAPPSPPTNEEIANVKEWQSNPYLSMLASPLRKCMWSEKVMPKDFLIPLKAATYELPNDDDKSSNLANPSTTSSNNVSTPLIVTATTAAAARKATTVFPRSLLHPSYWPSSPAQDNRIPKENRSYVICCRTAIHSFISSKKESTWKRMGNNVIQNPLLLFQVESQLRRRVLQELQILVAAAAKIQKRQEKKKNYTDNERESVEEAYTENDQKPPVSAKVRSGTSKAIRFSTLDEVTASQLSQEAKLTSSSFGDGEIGASAAVPPPGPPPAAILHLKGSDTKSQTAASSAFSRLVTYQSPVLKGKPLRSLAEHRIPIYTISHLFHIPMPVIAANPHTAVEPVSTSQSTLAPASASASSDNVPIIALYRSKPKKEPKPPEIPATWEELKLSYPKIYEREVQASRTQEREFYTALEILTGRTLPEHVEGHIASGDDEASSVHRFVAIPSGDERYVPLLKALWRMRMWFGEGWSGDGFGVLEATGRK